MRPQKYEKKMTYTKKNDIIEQLCHFCAQDETRTHTESKFESYFFSLTINQLVSNFKYHFTLGRFGQILGHFLSIQKRVQRYKKYLTCANFKA